MALPINSSTSNKSNSSDSRSSSYLKNAKRRATSSSSNSSSSVSVSQTMAGTYKTENGVKTFVPSNVTIKANGYEVTGAKTGGGTKVNGETVNLAPTVNKSIQTSTVTKVTGITPSGNVMQNIGGRSFKTYIPPNVQIQQYPRLTQSQERNRQLRNSDSVSDQMVGRGRSLVATGFGDIKSQNRIAPDLLKLYGGAGKVAGGSLLALGGATSEVLGLERGGRFFFSDKKTYTVYKDTESYSNFVGRQSNKRGDFEAGANLLILGGTFATGKPAPIGDAVFVGASKNVAQVIQAEGKPVIISSVVESRGVVQRSFFGIPLRDKPVVARSKSPFVEVVTDTGFLGGVTKEPIFSTKGSGMFEVSMGNKAPKLFEVSSQGGSVGEVGQRFTIVQSLNKRGQKPLGATNSFVESFVVKNEKDVLYGGSVQTGGVQFFGSRNILENQGVKSNRFVYGRYVDDLTGLDYAGSDFRGKSLIFTERGGDIPFNVRVFEGASVSQDPLPFSALQTRGGVVDLLKRERAGKSKTGDVGIFKESENVDTFLIQKGKTAQPFLNFDTTFKNLVETSATPKTRFVATTTFKNNAPESVNTLRLNEQKTTKADLKFESINFSLQSTKNKNISLNEISLFSKINSALKSDSKLNSLSLFGSKNEIGSRSELNSLNISKLDLSSRSIVNTKQNTRQLLDVTSLQRTKQTTRQGSPPFNPFPFPNTPFLLPFKLPRFKTGRGRGLYSSNKKKKIFNEFGVYALPDLRSVNITEAITGREATAPLLRGKTRVDVYKAFKGLSSGYIPTREIQLRKV